MPSRLRSLRSSLACPSMRLWIAISINSPGSVLAQRFFFFFLGSESWILFSGIRGDHPYHLGVPEQRGEGHVSGVPGGGFGGEKLKTEERPYCFH